MNVGTTGKTILFVSSVVVVVGVVVFLLHQPFV